MKRYFSLLAVAACTTTIVAVSCSDDSTGPKEQYVVQLTGAKERPNPNGSTATATATVTVADANTINFTITTPGINEVTAGHFHAADETAAGPVIYGFIANATPSATITGTLYTGTILRTSTFNTNAGFNFDSLLTRMRAGTAYLNIHSKTFPGGEIRGQVKKS